MCRRKRRRAQHQLALTGATGYVGSHVLTELHAHGHEVTALVRDDTQAAAVADLGAKPAVVDLYDRAAVVNVLSHTDGAVHTASPGDATSADLDSAVVDAVIEGFRVPARPTSKSLVCGFMGTICPFGRTPPSRRPH